MVYFNLHQITHNLKSYVNSWKSNELVFSYELKTISTKTEMTISLQQQETNFCIFMDIEEQKHCLRITRFALVEDARLESLSDALYDAALIEIVLQALNLVFFCTEHQNQDEAVFMLPEEETDHLTPFNSFFDGVSFHLITAETWNFLTLPTSSHDYDIFVKHASTIKAKVRQELWKLQRADPLIRQYLQNPRQSLMTEFTSLKEQDIPDLTANVIAFPKLALQG
jgi:hypothetical protein